MLNLKDFIKKLIILAETQIPLDVFRKLEEALTQEESTIGKLHLSNMIENVKISAMRRIPICQDTGILEFFIKIGKDMSYSVLAKTINEAVSEVDILRHNTIDVSSERVIGNVPKIYILGSDECTEIDLIVKGGGSESVTILKSFPPTKVNVERALLEGLKSAYKACPPHFIGIGLSGIAEEAIILSKLALLRGTEDRNLLNLVNKVGYGPQGTGGSVTALSVRKMYGVRHPATYFVGITFNCWALRYARGRICGKTTEVLSEHLNIREIKT